MGRKITQTHIFADVFMDLSNVIMFLLLELWFRGSSFGQVSTEARKL